jgi:NAD dependent epimerase/dehydratase family enzyme
MTVSYKVASQEVQAACMKLKDVEQTIKRLEEQEEIPTGMVQNFMGETSALIADGRRSHPRHLEEGCGW